MVSKRAEVRTNNRTAKGVGRILCFQECNLLHAMSTLPRWVCWKTGESLKERINSHRKSFYATLRQVEDVEKIETDDTNILGVHLIKKHQITARDGFDKCKDFNKSYKVSILANDVTPSNIRIIEQSFIDRLNTLAPFGLNQINSLPGF